MRIGALARQVGMRTSAIRYYESLGLIAPAARVSGRREYSPRAADTLVMIQAAQRAGFRLREIRPLLDLGTNRGAPGAWKRAALAKLDELDASIRELEKARRTLAAALGCDCRGHVHACRLAKP